MKLFPITEHCDFKARCLFILALNLETLVTLKFIFWLLLNVILIIQ